MVSVDCFLVKVSIHAAFKTGMCEGFILVILRRMHQCGGVATCGTVGLYCWSVLLVCMCHEFCAFGFMCRCVYV